MSEKVTLFKQQAEALEYGRSLDSEEWVISVATHDSDYFTAPELRALNDVEPMDIVRAIVNGYEIEKTPEDKLREYYEATNGLIVGHGYDYDRGAKVGIIKTLDILGITIEGVNA